MPLKAPARLQGQWPGNLPMSLGTCETHSFIHLPQDKMKKLNGILSLLPMVLPIWFWLHSAKHCEKPPELPSIVIQFEVRDERRKKNEKKEEDKKIDKK